MKKVLIYCRESRDDGFANYGRIETQRDILIDYCERQGLGAVTETVMDDNKSGTCFERLMPVREMVYRKEIDLILCKDASRLGRNILETLQFTEFLNENGVELVFESERYDEEMFPLIAWFNERRARDDSLKIRRVLRHRMETGEMVIKAPYGYTKDGNRLIPDGRAAPAVRDIFGLFVNGMNMGEIASIMNERGCPTPSALKSQYDNTLRTDIWNRQHIRRILRHPAYSGDMPYGMREKAGFKSKRYIYKDKNDWIIIKDRHESIVTREVFVRAQDMMRRMNEIKPRVSRDCTFSGMLFCGRCGSRMKRRDSAYICGKNRREGGIRGNAGCTPHRVWEKTLYENIRRFVDGFVGANCVRPPSDYTDTPAEAPKKINAALTALRKKLSLLYDDRLNGLIPDFLYAEKLTSITDEINFCERQLSILITQKTETAPLTPEKIKQKILDNIDRAAATLLFDRIIVFGPEEITPEHAEGYSLTETDYRNIKADGGIVFLLNFCYN